MSHRCERCAQAHASIGERRGRLVRAPGRALASTRALLGGRRTRRGRGWADDLGAERLGKPALVRVGAPAPVGDR